MLTTISRHLLLTPQERGSVFSTLNYKVNDNVETYAEVLMNRTHSGFQIAPLPFDATADDTIVAANNIYIHSASHSVDSTTRIPICERVWRRWAIDKAIPTSDRQQSH